MVQHEDWRDDCRRKGGGMKAGMICSAALIGFLVATPVELAGAQENCSRAVVTAILQEERGIETPLVSDINKEVDRCRVMEQASAAEDRCSTAVARASLMMQGTEEPSQQDITKAVDECKRAKRSSMAQGMDNRCSAEVARAALGRGGVEGPTNLEVTAWMRSCKADEYYRKKIMESKSSLGRPNAEKSRQARVTAFVKTIQSLKVLRQAWLTPVNKDWDTGPLVSRGN